MNFVTDEVANSVHFDDMWQSKKNAQSFESAIAEMIIGGAQVTGSTIASIQRVYKADNIQKDLIRTNGWKNHLFEIIDWDTFGIVFHTM